MNTQETKPGDGITALCLLAFVVLVTAKAIGVDIPWVLILSPIWGRMAYLIIIESLGNR